MNTAVEWLVDEIEKHYIINNAIIDPTIIMELKRQALEKERQEKINFASDYVNSDCIYCSGEFGMNKDAGEYYDETFKK